MMNLSVNIDPKQMADIDRRCGLMMDQSKINAAINRAAKRAADSAKTEIKRQIPKLYTIPGAHVAKTITTFSNMGSGTVGTTIKISDSPIALPKFTGTIPNKPNPKNPQIQKITIKKSEGVKAAPGWFPAQMKSGHIGIFKRMQGSRMSKPYQRSGHSKWGRDSSKGREQLDQEFGPGVANMVKNAEIVESVTNRASEILSKRIDHEIERLLEK